MTDRIILFYRVGSKARRAGEPRLTLSSWIMRSGLCIILSAMLNTKHPDSVSTPVGRSWLYYPISALILLLPALAVVVEHGASGTYLLLWFTALLCLWGSLRHLQLDADERILLWILLGYFSVVLISWLLSGQSDAGLFHVKRAARVLVVVPLYLLLRRLDPDLRWFAAGCMAGAVLAGVWAIDHFIAGYRNAWIPRANGATHPILFGNLSLSMAVIAVAMWRLHPTKWWRVFAVSAVLLGLTASLFSATRGGWIALPVLSLLLIWFLLRSTSVKVKLAVCASLVASAVVLYLIPETGIQERVLHAQQDLQRYTEGDTVSNSLGERFNMWHASLILMQQNPLFGAGVGQFISEAQRLMQEGVVGDFDVRHYHAHSIYFTALGQLGLIGLGLTLAMLIYPLVFFWRSLRSSDAVIGSAALSGVCLVVAYIHFGLTEAMFTRSLSIIFYVFCVVVLFSTIVNRRKHLQRIGDAS